MEVRLSGKLPERRSNHSSFIYDGKKEMGRIIDSPIESFERDLLKILRKEHYQPHFYDLQL